MPPRSATTSRLTRAVLAVVAVLVAAVCGACNGDAASTPDAAPRAGAHASDASPAKSPAKRQPAYDDAGVPLPDPILLALGAPVPQGFERASKARGEAVYAGAIPGEKVYEFYARYLETPHVIEAKRGWTFKMATPRAPGDTTRLVDVVVTKRGKRHSQIVVFDRMGRENHVLPDAGVRTEEDLHKAAHQGIGSVRDPIPGTY
jgi:hypothetical protein